MRVTVVIIVVEVVVVIRAIIILVVRIVVVVVVAVVIVVVIVVVGMIIMRTSVGTVLILAIVNISFDSTSNRSNSNSCSNISISSILKNAPILFVRKRRDAGLFFERTQSNACGCFETLHLLLHL